MTRPEQYRMFNKMVCCILDYADIVDIPIRIGTVHRTYEECKRNVEKGTGILNSRHRYSLAIDIWIIDSTGKKIIWADKRYGELGTHWRLLGGEWGGEWPNPDLYHFQLRERVA